MAPNSNPELQIGWPFIRQSILMKPARNVSPVCLSLSQAIKPHKGGNKYLKRANLTLKGSCVICQWEEKRNKLKNSLSTAGHFIAKSKNNGILSGPPIIFIKIFFLLNLSVCNRLWLPNTRNIIKKIITIFSNNLDIFLIRRNSKNAGHEISIPNLSLFFP